MHEPQFTIEEASGPDEIARTLIQDECHPRNSTWLRAHWSDVLPQARGKFQAIAGQELFIASTPANAWAWVHDTPPEAKCALVRYVRAEPGPRIPGYMQISTGTEPSPKGCAHVG